MFTTLPAFMEGFAQIIISLLLRVVLVRRPTAIEPLFCDIFANIIRGHSVSGAILCSLRNASRKNTAAIFFV